MTTYKKALSNGGSFLVNPNTSREKLLTCEFGGFNVRVSNKGRTVAERSLKEDEGGRYFVMNKIKYYLKEVA